MGHMDVPYAAFLMRLSLSDPTTLHPTSQPFCVLQSYVSCRPRSVTPDNQGLENLFVSHRNLPHLIRTFVNTRLMMFNGDFSLRNSVCRIRSLPTTALFIYTHSPNSSAHDIPILSPAFYYSVKRLCLRLTATKIH
jgi:hypothetical protein